jgi:hypothetical protein
MQKTPSVCRVKKRVQGGETMQSLADLLQNFAQHSGVQPVNVADGEAADAGMMMEDVVDPELEMLLSQYDQRQQRLQIAIPSAERQLMPTTSELPSPTDFEMLDPTLEMVLSQYDRF